MSDHFVWNWHERKRIRWKTMKNDMSGLRQCCIALSEEPLAKKQDTIMDDKNKQIDELFEHMLILFVIGCIYVCGVGFSFWGMKLTEDILFNLETINRNIETINRNNQQKQSIETINRNIETIDRNNQQKHGNNRQKQSKETNNRNNRQKQQIETNNRNKQQKQQIETNNRNEQQKHKHSNCSTTELDTIPFVVTSVDKNVTVSFG